MRKHLQLLPPLDALRAFEATAGHLSFTKAAREFRVTQGAVSRHVAVLERALGAKLFLHHHRSIELTPTRLARLHAADRRLDVQITTSHSPADFDREDIDVAIHSGDEPPPGVIAQRLFGETLTPVCSPALLRAGRSLRRPADLARHTLLCSLHRPNDWPTWITAARVTGVDGNSGLKFENSSLTYEGAIDRLGIAMAQAALVADDLAAGRLVAPYALKAPTTGAYFLIYPPRSRELDKIRRFESWILSECRAMEKTR